MTVSQAAPMGATTNQLIPFDFEECPVRVTLDQHGALWFHAGDVCRVLGYANPRDAVATHVDPEDVGKRDTLSAGGMQQTNFVNESGLYALVFGSTKPEAKRFKRWVTSDVLPSIRQTGGYGLPHGVREAIEELVQAVKPLTQQLPPPGERPTRGELRARFYGGQMAYDQAVRPIHLEYGKAWTTSLHIALASDLNHMVMEEKILRRLVHEGCFKPDEVGEFRASSPSTDGFNFAIPFWRFSESGAMKLLDVLGGYQGLEQEHRDNVQRTRENLVQEFARFNSPVPGRPRGRPKKPNAQLARAIEQLNQALNQGGTGHG